jgi:hypothetical protein
MTAEEYTRGIVRVINYSDQSQVKPDANAIQSAPEPRNTTTLGPSPEQLLLLHCHLIHCLDRSAKQKARLPN